MIALLTFAIRSHLDHSHEGVRLLSGAANLQPSRTDHTPSANGAVDSIDNGFELLLLGKQLPVAPFDQVGRLRGEQFAVLPTISARDMPIIFSAAC
ncbi:hypothetical protein BwSF12_03890 [Bradyrhizobium ottawaense]|uniref:hypothetical protein n=1 Tax=Bradyrhizobium ottawaense TaxID=931866 RepID=UPI0027D53DE3|nr:hypothetical protein BwSF12_03890 [Bradyrhizobium ottawaense]GMO92305.1 hypothetical protein BwSF19_71740 [Bradyrhizobium ottawaense]